MSVNASRGAASAAASAARMPPAPEPQPTSRMRPPEGRGCLRNSCCTRSTKRYVSGPKNTASSSRVGNAECANSVPPSVEKRTALRSRPSDAGSSRPAARSGSVAAAGSSDAAKGRLQPNTSRRLRATRFSGRALTRACVAGVTVVKR
ncbi:MAG: hypothetical protein K0S48_1603 [Ramlibacter sp.]|nr:hypothetical protein [Ramlibacter sp.]